MAANIIEFLELHELLPVPTLEKLNATWSVEVLQDFLNRYLSFLRLQAESLHQELDSGDAPSCIFLDPIDCGRKETFLQHALLADALVIMDPISVLHCPPRPLAQWLQQLHGSLVFIHDIRQMIVRRFVRTVPDPTHCGLHAQAVQKAQAILEDQHSREIWYEHGYACKGSLPARMTVNNGPPIEGPLYHLHLGPHFTMTGNFRGGPTPQDAMSSSPHIHFDMGGQEQRFHRTSIKNAIIYGAMEKQVKDFFVRPIAQYEASLLMARLWSHDRFSSLNPLTSSVLSRDLATESRAVSEQSSWIVPAECALRMLGIDSTDVNRALDFRDKHSTILKPHINAMNELFREIQSTPASNDFRKEVSAVVRDRIEPQFREIEAEAKSALGAMTINSGFFGLIAVAGSALILADPKNWISNAGTAIGGLGTAANIAAEWWKGRIAQARNPLYLLWKARKHSLSERHS